MTDRRDGFVVVLTHHISLDYVDDLTELSPTFHRPVWIDDRVRIMAGYSDGYQRLGCGVVVRGNNPQTWTYLLRREVVEGSQYMKPCRRCWPDG